MKINNSIISDLVFEQYRHDKLSLIIEDGLDDGLFQIVDFSLNDSNCLYIALKILETKPLNDKHQSSIFDEYKNKILYLSVNYFQSEDELISYIDKYVEWLLKYLKDNKLIN
jgi:hypothetical protein